MELCKRLLILAISVIIGIQYSFSWETHKKVVSPFTTFEGPYGLKQCIKECLRRKACLNMGYDYRHLRCELSSVADMDVIDDVKSIVVPSSFLSLYEPLIGQCVNHTCDEGHVCVPLTTGSAVCVSSDLRYYISDVKTTWSDALDECKKMSGHLLKIENQMKNDWITSKLENSGYWIGANDILVEGSFVWESDSSIASFTLWNPNEPNNSNNEDCVGILKSGKWNDYGCSHLLQFICEI